MTQHKTVDRRKAATDAQSVAQRLAAQKEKQGQAARNVATPSTTGSTGAYYSPREYGTQSGAYAARVDSTKKAMEEHGRNLGASRREVQSLYEAAKTAEQAYQNTKGKFRGANAAQYERQMLDSWTTATRNYADRYQAFQKELEAYQPYEDAYKAALGEYNSYVAQEKADYGAWRATVRSADEIRKDRQEIRGKRAELERLMRENNRLNDPGQINYGSNALGRDAAIAGNEARIRELQEYLGAVGERERLLEEELEYSEYFRFEDLRQNEDFARESRYQADRFQGGEFDDLYHVVNGVDVPEALKYYTRMGQDEISMFNYLYAAKGAEAANEYLGYLAPELKRRSDEELIDDTRAWAREHPILASGASVLMSPISGVISALGNAGTIMTGGELDPNAGYNGLTNMKNALREGVSAEVEENWGSWGSVGYGIGMSMLDMLADKWTGIGLAGGGNKAGTVIKGVMGSRVVAEGVIDAKNRGLPDEQALALGLANGAAELITEGIGLDEMLKLPEGMKDAGFWRGALKGAVSEAGEEGLTNLANLVADISIAGDKSEFMQNTERYKAQGKDPATASVLALKEAGISLGLDVLGGGISGSVFGGVDGWRSKRAANVQQKKENAADGAAQEETPTGGETDGTTVQGAREPVGAGTGDQSHTAPADSAQTQSAGESAGVTAQADSGNVQKRADAPQGKNRDGASLEELKREAVNRRNPLISGVMQTAQDEELVRRIQNASTKTEVTALDRGLSQEDTEMLLRIREYTGREIIVEEFNDTFHAYYDRVNDEIHVAADSKNIMASSFGHELTHTIEKTMGWEKLLGLVQERTADQGQSWEKLRQEKIQFYAGKGQTLTAEGADAEIVARYVEQHLLTDENAIRQLVRDDRSMARRILDWLDSIWAKVAKTKGAKEREFIRKARECYRTALGEAGERQKRRELHKSMKDAYADGDDDAGDAIFEEYYGGSQDALLEEPGDYDPEDDWMLEFSFAGENAKGADQEALARAKQMERDGDGMRKIFRETGWFRGADRKWRFEVDDSGMKYHKMGDAQFSKDHPEYARFRELELKFIEGTITDAEIAEMAELRSTWANEAPRLRQMVVRGNAKLRHVLAHDALFEQYPQLLDVRVRFGDTDDAGGYWDQERNEIVISNRYRHADPAFLELTLLHEIQHAIQNIEGFTGGSNPEYWEERQKGSDPIRENDVAIAKAEREARAALEGVPPEVQKDFWYAANMRHNDPEGAEALENELFEGEHADAYSDYSWAIWTLQDLLEQDNPKRTAKDLYRSTAGEIEARDAANRRHLDAEARKKRLPDTGDERTVFVEGGVWSAATGENETKIKEQIAANVDRLNAMEPVVEKKITANLKNKRAAKEWAVDYLKSTGYRVDRQGYGVIYFNPKDIEYGLNYSDTLEEQIAIAAIPQVLKRGIVIGEHGNHKLREKATITFGAPVILNGTRVNVAVVVEKRGNRYYTHRVVLPDGKAFRLNGGNKKNVAQEAHRGVLRKKSLADATSATSTDSVPDSGQNVKQYSMEELRNRASMEEDDGGERETWTAVEPESLKGTVRQHYDRALRDATGAVARALNVPRVAKRDFLQPVAEELGREYMERGTVSAEVRDRLFEQAWKEGRIQEREFYETYKEVKDYLRTTALTLGEEDRDSRDWKEFQRRAFGNLKLKNEGGLPVDTAWGELREMAPELFPEDIWNPADQLQHMLEVARSIKPKEQTLEEYYGPDAAQVKEYERMDFDSAVQRAIAELWKVKRLADERIAETTPVAGESGSALTQEEVTAMYPKLKDARKVVEKTVAKNILTKRDKEQVQRLLRHDIQPEHLDPKRDNVEGIMAVYEAKKAFEEIAEPIREWNRMQKAANYRLAEKLLEGVRLKDKKRGFSYSRETMARNIRDIVKDPEAAERIIKAYFKPVQEGSAEAIRVQNKYRDRVRALELSRKVKKGDTVSEAYAVQFYGEVSDILKVLQEQENRMKRPNPARLAKRIRDGKTYEEWQSELKKLWEENPGLDKEKIENAAREFGKIYEELFGLMNEVRVRNGYEPINHRSGYFPHFQREGRDGLMAQFGKALGIDVEVQQLPTTINGLTHTFKPGIRWFGNALERKTFDTAYDAVEGFDRYVTGAADVICHTDNIQRLRALANQIRYRTSDEGIREQIRKIQERTDITEDEKDALIRERYESGKFELSNFVVELDEYTNLLANKKSRADRNMEQAMGRDMYNIVKSLESRVAANMVAINPGSWLTNFIPLTQGWACLDRGRLLRGMVQTLKARKNDDGIVDKSAFLTGRKGTDALAKTWAQEWSGRLSHPMEVIDSFTAGALVRARYQQNLELGLSETEAMSEADEWAAGVMADRSKGSMPTVFHRSNPLTKLFTQFQLEVNNQLSYAWKDIPREKRDKGKKALALALLKFALGAWLYNEAYEFFLGRRPALDPIDMTFGFAGDLADPELDFADAALGLGGAVAENTPFIGGLLGGGRVPISSALPDMENLIKAVGNEEWSAGKRLSTAAKELAKPAMYMLPPFGGGQIKKVWEGLKMVAQGGSYTLDAEGNPMLQYPLYSTDNAVQKALEAGQAMVFGKTTIRSGREWVEDGFGNLSAEQTATYQALISMDVEQADAFELLTQLREAEKTDTEARTQVQRDILRNSGLEGDALATVYYDLMTDEDSKDRAMMDELLEGGADLGKATHALMDIKDAEAMLTGTEASNAKREILRGADLEGDALATMYYHLMAGDEKEQPMLDRLRGSGADMGKAAKAMMAIKDADANLAGAKRSNTIRDAIRNSGLTETQKREIYRYAVSEEHEEKIGKFKAEGLDFDDYLIARNQYSTIDEQYEDEGDKATAFARWVNKQGYTAAQKDVVRAELKYWKMMPADSDRYDAGIEAGLSDEEAYGLREDLQNLTPLEGEDDVKQYQKWREAIDNSWSEENQLQCLKAVGMNDAAYAKCEALWGMGVAPAAYVRAQEIKDQFDTDGNGSLTNEDWRKLVNSLAPSGIALPGDKEHFNLTNEQMGFLWQMLSGRTSAKNNPFSPAGGEKWLAIKEQMKEEKEG